MSQVAVQEMSNGENAEHLKRNKVAEIKLQMYSCVRYVLENLDARYLRKDLEIYKVVRVVDPRLRKTTKLNNGTRGKCLSKLLRIFEVPLHRFVDPKRVLQSHELYGFYDKPNHHRSSGAMLCT